LKKKRQQDEDKDISYNLPHAEKAGSLWFLQAKLLIKELICRKINKKKLKTG
jgi:hypothetical protein